MKTEHTENVQKPSRTSRKFQMHTENRRRTENVLETTTFHILNSVYMTYRKLSKHNAGTISQHYRSHENI